MITIVLRVLSIFVMVGIGFLLNKKDILPKSSLPYLMSLLMLVATPCINFYSMASVPFEYDKVRPIIEVIIGSVFYFVLTFPLSFIVIKAMRYRPIKDAGILMAVMTAANTGFMGFPVTKSIFGNEYLFYMVIINAIHTLYLFFFILIQFNYKNSGDEKLNIKKTLKEMMNLPLIFMLVGIFFFLTRITLPNVVLDLTGMLGDMTVPLSMVIIGIQLGNTNLKELFIDKYLLFSAFVKLVAVPGIIFAIVFFLPLTTFGKVTIVLSSCFPTAAMTTPMANKYKKNDILMAKGVAMTTVFSIFSVSIWCVILQAVFM